MSVVIPLYNKAAHVAEAVRSVQAQSFADLELIVVDDGSTDGGDAVAHAAGDHRLRLIRQENAGAGAARNAGIAAARGRWVAFLDADDTWRPERLARQLGVLEREPDLVWAAGMFFWTNPERSAQRPCSVPDERWFEAPEIIGDALALLAKGRHIWTGTVMVCRTVLADLGGFDTTLRTGQDLFLWVRLATNHPRLAYVSTPIADYVWDVRGSLTNRKVLDGYSSDLEIACRLEKMSRALPSERARLFRIIARELVFNQAKNEFVTGRFRDARTTLALGRPFGFSLAARALAIATYFPERVTLLTCRWGMRLRRRLGPSRSVVRTDVTDPG